MPKWNCRCPYIKKNLKMKWKTSLFLRMMFKYQSIHAIRKLVAINKKLLPFCSWLFTCGPIQTEYQYKAYWVMGHMLAWWNHIYLLLLSAFVNIITWRRKETSCVTRPFLHKHQLFISRGLEVKGERKAIEVSFNFQLSTFKEDIIQ